jgi:hypothetical protein
MQDSNTGNLIMIKDSNKELLADVTKNHDIKSLQGDTFDPEQVANEIKTHGFCVLQVGEQVTIKGNSFKIERLQKKHLTLSTEIDIFVHNKANSADSGYLPNEYLSVNKGTFQIEYVGQHYLQLRAKAGTHVFNRKLIDAERKKNIKKTI